jgi:hypothetical protein
MDQQRANRSKESKVGLDRKGCYGRHFALKHIARVISNSGLLIRNPYTAYAKKSHRPLHDEKREAE